MSSSGQGTTTTYGGAAAGGAVLTMTGSGTDIRQLRERLLDDAKRIVVGDRDKQYSGPEESFTVIAEIWSTLFDREFTASEVAMALAALKLARLKTGGTRQQDTWTDIAGYAACGYEVSERATDATKV